MRKVNVIGKDKKKRELIFRLELRRNFLKCIIAHGSLSRYQSVALFLLNKLPKDSSYIRQNNYCILTGRNKGIYRRFRLSRIQIRELLGQGLLPGYKKRSW